MIYIPYVHNRSVFFIYDANGPHFAKIFLRLKLSIILRVADIKVNARAT